MHSIDGLKSSDGSIDRENIKKVIPYEEPFVMIDRVMKLSKKEIVAEKTAVAEEFHGHFRDFPIMPGALVVEGLGQAATFLVRYNLDDHEKKDVLAYKISNAKFFRPTFPGHTIRFEAKLVFKFKMLYWVKGKVFRNEKPVANTNIVLAVVDREKFRGRYQKK